MSGPPETEKQINKELDQFNKVSVQPPNQEKQKNPNIQKYSYFNPYRHRKPWTKTQPIKFYPENTYIYPYYCDSSGCFYCCCCNGHCCPSQCCHDHDFSEILCDPYPCCNGCTGFHCGCLKYLPCFTDFNCVKNNGFESCDCLPCCTGCQYCAETCDGACISAMPCCNDLQCYQCRLMLPCCNGCWCQQLFGCLPCCNDDYCNIFQCLNGCEAFECERCGCSCCSCCSCCGCSCDCESIFNLICGCICAILCGFLGF